PGGPWCRPACRTRIRAGRDGAGDEHRGAVRAQGEPREVAGQVVVPPQRGAGRETNQGRAPPYRAEIRQEFMMRGTPPPAREPTIVSSLSPDLSGRHEWDFNGDLACWVRGRKPGQCGASARREGDSR